MVRRSRSRIHALKNCHNEWIHDKEKVESMVQEYYKILYTKESELDDLDSLRGMFPVIESEQWDTMNRRVTIDEPEVTELEPLPAVELSGKDKNVLGLQVAVDDSPGVHVMDAFKKLISVKSSQILRYPASSPD
nr:uncharacterized protein LOC109149189 [Ipomoea trifida]